MLVPFKLIFIIIAALYLLLTVYGKWKVFYKKTGDFVSDYCAVLAGVIIFYVLFSLTFVVICPFIYQKIIMLFFAISPFLLGLLANYHTEKYYTFIQVLLILFSMAFVWGI